MANASKQTLDCAVRQPAFGRGRVKTPASKTKPAQECSGLSLSCRLFPTIELSCVFFEAIEGAKQFSHTLCQ